VMVGNENLGKGGKWRS